MLQYIFSYLIMDLIYLCRVFPQKHCSTVLNINKTVPSIYNSVVACRQNIINSSVRAPLNAKKIAEKKVSDVDVSMFGPEL